ncbi:hypothetical protein NHJ13734_004690 [Beauveria thailandica]
MGSVPAASAFLMIGRRPGLMAGGPFINVGVAWELLHGAAELGCCLF